MNKIDKLRSFMTNIDCFFGEYEDDKFFLLLMVCDLILFIAAYLILVGSGVPLDELFPGTSEDVYANIRFILSKF